VVDQGDYAFAKTGHYQEDGSARYDSEDQCGMTMRQFYAAHAISSAVAIARDNMASAEESFPDTNPEVHQQLAMRSIGIMAFKIADSLIAAEKAEG
jgi:hypothetical protein